MNLFIRSLLAMSTIAALSTTTQAQDGELNSKFITPAKCTQAPLKPGENPMDPGATGCSINCWDSEGDPLCELNYNDCPSNCKQQSCQPCMEIEALIDPTPIRRSCNTIPKLCCIPDEGCWMEPVGGCDNVNTESRPYCWPMPDIE